MQAGLPRLNANRLQVLSRGIVPTVALKQEITEKTMPPCRLAIQMRSPVGQTSSQIEVLVSEFEPGLGLVGIKHGDLTELLSRPSELLLAQVCGGQSLARLPVGRIELQHTLEVWNCLLRRA